MVISNSFLIEFGTGACTNPIYFPVTYSIYVTVFGQLFNTTISTYYNLTMYEIANTYFKMNINAGNINYWFYWISVGY